MLSINFQARIFADYHAGKEYTSGTKYCYSIQYNPMALIHTWIIRQDKGGGEWYFLQPLVDNLQMTPRNSKRQRLEAFGPLFFLSIPYNCFYTVCRMFSRLTLEGL